MKKTLLPICCIIIVLITACSKKTIVIADFESDTFGEWLVEGDAFGNAPVEGKAVEWQNEVTEFQGEKLANSFHGGDDSRGVLISPEFTIERNYINFLIGGGMHAGTYMELIVDGESRCTSRAIVESETLHWLTWDVKQYAGKTAIIKIVDDQRGAWGHILVDQIEMSNTAKSNVMVDYEMTFDITQKLLLIPIEDKGPESQIYILENGKVVSPRLSVRVAQAKIDYWMPVNVEKYAGKSITLQFAHVKKTDIGFSQIKQSDTFNFEYNETYRPRFHFSPEHGWVNDPNGMVYYDGEYHLYFQHNPYGTMWGNMNWGHAVSTDLVSWTYLPVAISPDSLGTIFSGSAVIDQNNTAGFGKDALTAIYTSAGSSQTQSIAYSTDKGRTFTKHNANPVLADPTIADFRDPKVFWHEKTNQWIMSLATSQTITFYGSPDLKQWSKLSEFGEGIGAHGGVWECPDLFPLTTSDGKTKWVLFVSINPGGPNGGSATQYFIGNFDGQKFVPDALPYPLWLDYGRDNYAGVTWSNVPDKDGRRLFIGWMSNWDYANDVPTINFRNAMTLVRELTLQHNGQHLIVASNPVHEISTLRKDKEKHSNIAVNKDATIEKMLPVNNGAYEVVMNIKPTGIPVFGFGLTNLKNEYINFTFNLNENTLLIDRLNSGLTDFSNNFASVIEAPVTKKESYKVRLFVDKASTELFINDGEVVLTNLVFPTEVFNKMTFFSPEGTWNVEDIEIFSLN